MGELNMVSKMVINTAEGEGEIQLMFGDITKLPLSEKVDVIMVSAFPGDYAATPTSVIGALKRGLGLNVRELARDKQEDLRKHFCCWWSKPLPGDVPYRRLLCFERTYKQGGSHPSRLVGEVFRAMFPAFNNQDSTVITPLLAAGDQGYSPKVMLQSMVNAAANWMRHGLPLSCLKIVIYRGDKSLLELFEGLKKKWESLMAVLSEPSVKYDVYLSYCKEDETKVQDILKLLKSEKKDLKIFAEHQAINESADFQEGIFDIMITCVKVVAILSPSYLQSDECLEQFNIALCCDRKTRREMLAPFYTETIPALPTYMCMVQYIDVRIHESMEPLFTGCKIFIEQVQSIEHDTGDSVKMEVKASEMKYDVFISYCHKNTEFATGLFAMLQRLNPELRIFFDRNDLALGNTWQKSLYYAVGGASCMLALISQDYIKSLVCTEEYNLALAKHMCWENGNDSEFYLVPIAIESLEEIPHISSQVPIIDGREDYTQVITKVVSAINKWVSSDRFRHDVISDVETPLTLSDVMEEHRKQMFKEKVKAMVEVPPDMSSKQSIYVGFSYQPVLNKKHVEFLDKLLRLRVPQLKSTFSITSDADLVTALEKSDLTITFVTHPYTVTRKTTDEFHHALGRHRISKNGPILYPIMMEDLPFNPLFFHLVPCAVNCGDALWKEKGEMKDWKKTLKTLKFDPVEKEQLKDLAQTLLDHEVLALNFACWDIINTVMSKSEGHGQNIVLDNIMKIQLHNKGSTLSDQLIHPDDMFYKKIHYGETTLLKDIESLKVETAEPNTSTMVPDSSIVDMRDDNTGVAGGSRRDDNTDKTGSRRDDNTDRTESVSVSGSKSNVDKPARADELHTKHQSNKTSASCSLI